MIKLKSQGDIAIMKQGGRIASEALKTVLLEVKAGMTTLELDAIADRFIKSKGGLAGFKTVEGYSYATCININDTIVHGIPNDYCIKEGDLVSVDLGVLLNGLHTDLSYTLEVGTTKEALFLAAGKKALQNAINACILGNFVGDVSHAMQKTVEEAGFSVSRELVGHGIGKDLHESPHVPCYGREGSGVRLKEGLALAVEVIYQKGSPDLRLLEDDWTLATADGKLSAIFEKTLIVTSEGPLVITEFLIDL